MYLAVENMVRDYVITLL